MHAPCTREGENGYFWAAFNLFNTYDTYDTLACTSQCVSFAANVTAATENGSTPHSRPKGADRVTADDNATGSSHPIMSESSKMILGITCTSLMAGEGVHLYL